MLMKKYFPLKKLLQRPTDTQILTPKLLQNSEKIDPTSKLFQSPYSFKIAKTIF